MAMIAVWTVRANGGVLEHPQGSSLWKFMDLPVPSAGRDVFGGYTICINQCDFGHRALKPTWLYVVGVNPDLLPKTAGRIGLPDRAVEQLGRAAREHTPDELACWLVKLAKLTLVRPGQPYLAGQVDRGA